MAFLGHVREFLKSDESKARVLKFLAKFLIFAIPLYIILYFNLEWQQLESSIAGIVSFLLGAMGFAVQRGGDFISIPVSGGQWGAFINWDCTGWKSFLALIALVMATDFSLDKKAKGLAVMLPALFAVNIARIVFMFWFVSDFGLAYFDLVHLVIWSWGLILTILVFWAIWMRWASGKTRNTKQKN